MKKTFLVLLLLNSPLLFSQPKMYPPTAEISDYTLSKFLTEFTLAVGKKDKSWILENMSSSMTNSWGGEGGIEEFKEYWNFDDPKSRFWKVAEHLLILGGSKYHKESNSYWLPYTFTDWDKLKGNYEPYEHSLITGTKVNVRNEPNITTSKVVAQLNYDIVQLPINKSYETKDQHQEIEPNYMGGLSWEYICTLDNKICGFVYWKFVTSPIGYRLGLTKTNSQWKITHLVAGD